MATVLPDISLESFSRDPAMTAVLQKAELIARSTIDNIMITGETGVGKGALARAIHETSSRAKGSFVAVNCAAIPHELIGSTLFGHNKGAFTGASESRDGIFRYAGRTFGTVFLDEVGELPRDHQIALLKIVDEKQFMPLGSDKPVHVDVRIISATNADLTQARKDDKFRQDLFFRLSGMTLTIPPLRSRQQDIERYSHQFLDQCARREGKTITGFDEDAMAVLRAYQWPGNVRELRDAIHRSVVMCDAPTIGVPHLIAGTSELADVKPSLDKGPKLASVTSLPQTHAGHDVVHLVDGAGRPRCLEDIERDAVERALARRDDNRAQAARDLGVNVRTIRNMIARFKATDRAP